MGPASATIADKVLLSDSPIEKVNRLVVADGGNVPNVAIANACVDLQEVQRDTHAFLIL
jgi:hypothetical protein